MSDGEGHFENSNWKVRTGNELNDSMARVPCGVSGRHGGPKLGDVVTIGHVVDVADMNKGSDPRWKLVICG